MVFKIRAYRNAAENILSRAARKSAHCGRAARWTQVPGIGKEIAKKIDELMRTGKLDFYEKLRAEVPDGVVALLQVPGVGPQARQGILARRWRLTSVGRAGGGGAAPANCATCPRWARRPSRKSWPASSR